MKVLIRNLYFAAQCMAVPLHLICCSDHAVITRQQAQCLRGSFALPAHPPWEQPVLVSQPCALSFTLIPKCQQDPFYILSGIFSLTHSKHLMLSGHLEVQSGHSRT